MNAEQRTLLDKQMEAIGFVATDVACQIVGRSRGGNFPTFMANNGVKSLESVCGKHRTRYYSREDCERVASRVVVSINADRMSSLERRVAALESLVNS